MQANVGEVIAWRNLFWALSDAMVRDPKPWIDGYVLPNMDPGQRLSDHRHHRVQQGQIHHRANRGVRV